jgi:hypothetical protein
VNTARSWRLLLTSGLGSGQEGQEDQSGELSTHCSCAGNSNDTGRVRQLQASCCGADPTLRCASEVSDRQGWVWSVGRRLYLQAGQGDVAGSYVLICTLCCSMRPRSPHIPTCCCKWGQQVTAQPSDKQGVNGCQVCGFRTRGGGERWVGASRLAASVVGVRYCHTLSPENKLAVALRGAAGFRGVLEVCKMPHACWTSLLARAQLNGSFSPQPQHPRSTSTPTLWCFSP